ncbi:putative fatty acyl-CoA reductase 4 [Dendrobium catenatum]|uniref:Fatty acyl-CoA reductase n=1 Tax=Dendrobium catenatum TaxID=906689 RepID=A0A2I0WW80_9ASPA|nr:putative fatty acyl-CoA reductase 4 [Dendrobium catenatum]
MYGWPNTYVFSKAMGEILLGHLRGEKPLVIMHPTIITSVYKGSLTGWIEGCRTIDSVILGYAKGDILCFLGDPEVVIDLIPGDMVVNAMILAIATHSNVIYHVSSSVRNLVKLSTIEKCFYQYIAKNRPTRSDGKEIKANKFHFIRTMPIFHRYMLLHYRLPLEVFDDSNLESLRKAMVNNDEMKLFDCDPKHIEWDDYLINFHIPGVIKYLLK